jgi:hypothetical protein
MMRISLLLSAAIAAWGSSFAYGDEIDTLLEWRLDSPLTASARIQSLTADGKVRLRIDPPRPGQGGPGDQFRRTVGLIWVAAPRVVKERDAAQIMSGVADEASTEGLTLQLSAAAVRGLAVGEQLLLRHAQDDDEWTYLKEPPLFPEDGASRNAEAQLASQNNLKQILLALHNYHDTYRTFPPACVYGPDGKAWHSWRVMILPFLGQKPLYDAYRFDEPWDSENNRQLLDKKPLVYQDPTRGPTPDQLAHYVAAVGKNTGLSDRGVTIDGMPNFPLRGTRFADIIDGTANTAVLGMVSRDREIPWTKPEDVVVGDLGTIDAARRGFAWPYGGENRQSGSFAFADAAIYIVPKNLSNEVLYHLFTINDGRVIPRLDETARIARPSLMLRLVRKGDGLAAEMAFGK